MVKPYDELNDAEKQKLQTFLTARTISSNTYDFSMKLAYGLIAISFIGGILLVAAGMSLLTTGILSAMLYGENSTITTGVYESAYSIIGMSPILAFIGLIAFAVIYFVAKYCYEQSKKVDFLVFGYDSIKDVCDIKKSDINDLKKTYKKVKK